MHPEAVFYLDAVQSEIESKRISIHDQSIHTSISEALRVASYNAGLDAAMSVIDRYLSGKGLYRYTSTDRKEPQESVYREH